MFLFQETAESDEQTDCSPVSEIGQAICLISFSECTERPSLHSVWENQARVAPKVIEKYTPNRTILKLSFVNAGAFGLH